MFTSQRFRALVFSLSLLFTFARAAAAETNTCLWEGRAPLCNGACRQGYELMKRDKAGDGDKCVTGTKAYCCLVHETVIRGAAPFCNGKCKVGEEYFGEIDHGPDGKQCVTGKAAICGVVVK